MASIKYKTEDGYVSIPMTVPTKTNAENGNGIGTCSTSSGTALTVSLTGYELVVNGFVAVTFANDVPANATLNVNNKGAKPIIYKGAAITADTIKADDTVMFAYDGTNYVVTSLGGSGSTQTGETVIINLSTDDDDDLDLVGASVKIYDTDVVSKVYLETTWQGGDIQFIVPSDINYTVEVSSNINDHEVEINTQSYTAELVQRNVNFVYENALWVDLGLPSGVIWAKRNADATQSNGFTAGKFQLECTFCSWGNVTGHNPISTSKFDYDFGTANSGPYASTPGSNLSGDIPVNNTYDLARAACGGSWRIPTSTEFVELFNNCNFVQADGETIISDTDKRATINGIKGVYLKSKINGKHIFFPCAGRANSTNLLSRGGECYYWSKTIAGNGKANYFLGSASWGFVPKDSQDRFYGHTIRPVRN